MTRKEPIVIHFYVFALLSVASYETIILLLS